ncbi:MAG: 16S rRNA (uracil(1498)-N(3))-methyltransferase [Actinomycetia bacterium]|nr:16S rRNA (uracil(1498)-N(3))-methyltransferase [Actinomycetes bacterium]MCP4959280.1 16S rRNA (uracil(1498)-N(3))-methyltransferase [Actinomycetes bacterium]
MNVGFPDGTGGPHVFVDDIQNPALSEDDLHHLRRVRRLRDGDSITVSDGAGRWVAARFGESPELAGEIVNVESRTPSIRVGIVAVKGDRTSWAVQKLTELGVDQVVLIESSRSVVRWNGARADKAIERLKGVARSAAAQSRQVWLPEVVGPVAATDALSWGGVSVAHRGGGKPSLTHPTLLIGPEGGWSEDELGVAEHLVDLGPGVLRAETAAVAGATLLCGIRNLLVRGHAE